MIRRICTTFMFCILFFSIFTILLSRGICPGETENNQNKLTIIAPSQVDEDSPFFVTVKSNETAIENATVIINLSNFGTIPEEQIEITNSSGQAIFWSPQYMSVYATFNITASKEGYEPAKTTVTVINTPELYILKNPDISIINGGTPFTVTIISDEEISQNDTKVTVDNWTYKCISNVTVTFSNGTYNSTYLTDTNGKVTITFPSIKHKTTYVLTAKKSGYKPVETMTITVFPRHDDFPGFELIFVITAILLVLFYVKQKRK